MPAYTPGVVYRTSLLCCGSLLHCGALHHAINAL